jgi:hypothetical protein
MDRAEHRLVFGDPVKHSFTAVNRRTGEVVIVIAENSVEARKCLTHPEEWRVLRGILTGEST